MTAGAIFRNCSESPGLLDIYGALGGTAARTDSNVSGVILLSNGWRLDSDGRVTSFAVVCFGTAVSFLAFSLLLSSVAVPPLLSDRRSEMTMRADTPPAS